MEETSKVEPAVSVRGFLIATAIAFTLLVCAAAAVLVAQVDRYGRSQTEQQLLETTRALSLAVDGRLQGLEGSLRALATSQAIERGDFASFDARARSLRSDMDVWIVVGDREGRQLVNTRLPRGASLPSGPTPGHIWPTLDRNRSRICDLATGRIEPRILCIDTPVMVDGRAAYHLSAVFTPSALKNVFERQRVRPGHLLTILDRNGVVIWRNVSPDKFVGASATPDLLASMRERGEGLLSSVSLDGAPTRMAYSRSPLSGWTFIVAVPRHELGAGGSTALRTGALIALLLLLAALAVSVFAAGRIANAVSQLNNGASRIRGGGRPEFRRSGLREIDDVAASLEEAISQRDASRERFDLAQEVGGIGAWEWDLVADQGYVSDTYRQMHGLTEVEGPLRIAQVLATIHPEDLPGYQARLAAAKRHDGLSTNEYRVLRPDGSTAWIVAKGRPIFGPDGALTGAIGIVRDATAEHEAEDALRRLNDLLAREVEERTEERDRLWELARDPFVIADDQGVWLEASPAWTSILGWSREELLGRTSAWMEHPDDRERTRAEDRRLAGGMVTERFENRFRTRDGDYRWFSWTAVPKDGRFYSVARDITEEREKARQLREAEEALRRSQKLESIGQITGGVAHDFNNLLTPILGALDLLQKWGLPDERAQRVAANAMESAERARMLVQRLLAFARRQPLSATAVELPTLLDQLGPLLASSLGPQVAVRIDAPADLPPVSADRNQLELALINLAVNARDAMPSGGSLTVSARAHRVEATAAEGPSPGDYVELSVADTGSGMPPSVLERAIEPFFSTKGIGRGTGLGLSMVHGLMAQLGGAMRIESELGQGTAIRLLLPVADGDAGGLDMAEPGLPDVSASGRVLLVDDDAAVRAATAQMLADLGYEVTQADSAAEALAMLEANETPDVLVTDHLMPGMSGTELARQVRSQWPDLRLLIISGYADVDDIAPDLPRLGKPFRRIELARALGLTDD